MGNVPPAQEAAASRSSYDQLDRSLPGWLALYASASSVPWTRRSLDRRPYGLGSSPGIDLYEQNPTPFDPGLLQADLDGLSASARTPQTRPALSIIAVQSIF